MQIFKIKKNHGRIRQYVKVEKVDRLYLFEKISGRLAAVLILVMLLIGSLVVYAIQNRVEKQPQKIEERPPIRQEKLREKEKHEIIFGPKGGQYYINRNGNKTYLKKNEKILIPGK